MGKRSEFARVLAEVDAEIKELQRRREWLIDMQTRANPLVRRERKPTRKTKVQAGDVVSEA